MLRAELTAYKARFAQYEPLDRHRAMVGDEMGYIVQMVRAREWGSEKELSDMFTRIAERLLDERRKIFEQLARMMVELAVPFPMKFAIWKAENHVNVFDPATVNKITGNVLSKQQLDEMISRTRTMFPDKAAFEIHNKSLVECSNNIRGYVKRLLESQRGIQAEMHRLWVCKRNTVFKGDYTWNRLDTNMRWLPWLRANPELADCALYRIKDGDFSYAAGTDESLISVS